MQATVGMQSASDRAYAHVKRGILDGTHAGGQFFTEGEVADALGVSRTPVREALLRLEVEGLVRLYPKKGAVVVPVSAHEAQDLCEARAVIEEWAASRMWPRRREIVDDLRRLLALMHTGRKAGAVGEFVAADRAFHEQVVSAAGNPILTRTYRSLCERQMCASQVVIRVSDARTERAISSHRHLVELLTSGTKAEFLAACRHHLKYSHGEAGGVR